MLYFKDANIIHKYHFIYIFKFNFSFNFKFTFNSMILLNVTMSVVTYEWKMDRMPFKKVTKKVVMASLFLTIIQHANN